MVSLKSSIHFPLVRSPFIVLFSAAVVSAFLLFPSQAIASQLVQATSTPSTQPTPTLDPIKRLAKPVVSETPNQLEQGALKYWGVCMACHGDRGQGLTDEWRGVYGEDSNCWASKCHASNYPPEGFSIPKDKPIPAVAGSGKLSRFVNAQELHDFVRASMPWWNPKSLSDEQAWQVTAYILKLNKTLPEGIELKSTTAYAIPVHYAVASPGNQTPAAIIFAVVIALSAAGWLSQDLLARKATNKTNFRSPEKPSFFHHLHPPTIPAVQARFRYTLGTGGLSVFFSFILLVTGALEMFYYSPMEKQAAISIQVITTLVPYGGLVRNLHFWSAQALVIVMFIHLLRIVLTGAYGSRRQLNYLIGLGMLVLILFLDFTGYVLRWDEGIRWALIVGTNLLKTIPRIGDSIYQFVVGGSQPGASTIIRFYTWHVFVLTLGVIILGVWHIFRTRRDGGIAVPLPEMRKDNTRISRFELVKREVLVMLIAGLGLLIISIFIPAPISPPITEASAALGEARAPWFFLWIQELLKIGNPFLWGILVPITGLIILVLLPFVFPKAQENELGRWFPRGNRIAQVILILFIIVFTGLTLISATSNFQP